MTTSVRLSENQNIILEVLKRNNESMTLLALKKESKLANLYFFQALNVLKNENMVSEDRKSGTTVISM
ncbi:MAG: hypothetical protein ACW98F_14245 [Candidatus Hodarchaeales archaeon]|jgi:hypothetical protein